MGLILSKSSGWQHYLQPSLWVLSWFWGDEQDQSLRWSLASNPRLFHNPSRGKRAFNLLKSRINRSKSGDMSSGLTFLGRSMKILHPSVFKMHMLCAKWCLCRAEKQCLYYYWAKDMTIIIKYAKSMNYLQDGPFWWIQCSQYWALREEVSKTLVMSNHID